jgi:dinuclear metal center YbgI/SA1388 family protein
MSQVLRMTIADGNQGQAVTTRDALDAYLKTLLEVERFKDYGPNGLQVEGKPEIRKIVSGVTASLALIEAAVAAGADAIVVHHGLFWRGQDGRVTGWMKKRLSALLAREVNLFAYHLPLDAHPALGNNAQLGSRLKFNIEGRFGDQDLGFIGSTPQPMTPAALSAMLQFRLGRAPTFAEGDGRQIKRVAWCTGGAQGYFEAAIAAGVDAYLTGEISEPQAHYARETGVAFYACGHHATERYGAQAVAAHVAERFELEHEFIDIDNPA